MPSGENIVIRSCDTDMLNVKILEVSESAIPHMDIERVFDLTFETIEDTPMNRAIIEIIEHGQYLNGCEFIDRFGNTLYYDYLSTGSKAALLAANTDLEVDLIEAGMNVWDFLVLNLDHGNIIVYETGRSFKYPKGAKVDVQCDGYHFTTMSKFNKYLLDEWPDPPDLADPGITKL